MGVMIIGAPPDMTRWMLGGLISYSACKYWLAFYPIIPFREVMDPATVNSRKTLPLTLFVVGIGGICAPPEIVEPCIMDCMAPFEAESERNMLRRSSCGPLLIFESY